MSDIDYKYKSRILKTDLCKRINAIDKKTYLNNCEGIVQDNELDNAYFDLLLQYDYKDVEEARKINKASFYRVRRLKNRITDMLTNGHCIFATFNFSDDVLNSTTQETRRQYVRKYLKQFNCMYVANIDFGSDKEYIDRKGQVRVGTNREHYHALICIDKLPLNWSYGYQFLEHVRVRKSSDVKLSKYISKLTNHAIKETTRRSCLIYSR